MAVGILETRLPENYSANDLGESVSNTNKNLHLISVYPTNLFVGDITTFVVFALNKTISKYIWKIWNHDHSEISLELETDTGKIHWQAQSLGTYFVSVEIVETENSINESLELSISIENNSILNGIENIKQFTVGDRFVVKEIFHKIYPFIEAATNDNVEKKILVSYVYSSLLEQRQSQGIRIKTNLFYAQSIKNLKNKKYGKLIKGPIVEANEYSEQTIFNFRRKRGITSQQIHKVAYQIGLLDDVEIPSKFPFSGKAAKRKISKKEKELIKKFNALEKNEKIDLCNMLRFPKLNLQLFIDPLLKKHKKDCTEFLQNEENHVYFKLLTQVINNGGILFTPTYKKNNKFHIRLNRRSFGLKVFNASKLPVLTLILKSNEEEIKKLIKEWDDNKAFLIYRFFLGGALQYIVLSFYYEKLNKDISPLITWIKDNIVDYDFPLGDNKGIKKKLTALFKEFPDFTIPGVISKANWETNKDAFNSFLQINKKLVEPLNKIKGNPALANLTFNQIGSFFPRMVDEKHRLSNHSRGLALDFDWKTNPHLKSKHFNVLSVILDKEVTGNSFDGAKALNDVFNALDKSEFISSRKAPKDMAASLKLFDHHGNGGIMTLPKIFVDAMIDVGFEWGGNWENSKDFMHFDFKSRT